VQQVKVLEEGEYLKNNNKLTKTLQSFRYQHLLENAFSWSFPTPNK
jgi:hypothetical protein